VNEAVVHSDVLSMAEENRRKKENCYEGENNESGLKITLLKESEFHSHQSERQCAPSD
jgi:hypothetical protein